MSAILRDVRFGWHILRRRPQASFFLVASLALSTSAAIAIFAWIDAVVLRPLEAPAPRNQIVIFPKDGAGRRLLPSPALFAAWRRHAPSVSRLGAVSSRTHEANAASDQPGIAMRARVRECTPSYFGVFGVQPLYGSMFSDDGPAGEVILPHRTWRDAFRGDPSTVGRKIYLDDRPHLIRGILPPGLFDRERADVWLPLSVDHGDRSPSIYVIGTVGTGKPSPAAKVELARGRALVEGPQPQGTDTIELVSFRHWLVGPELRRALALLTVAVCLLLLATCVNGSVFLLASTRPRRREFAVRLAFGASRPRLARQVLTEILLICVLAGTAGGILAMWLLKLWVAWVPQMTPTYVGIRFDLRLGIVALATTLLAACILSLVPVLRLPTGCLRRALAEGADVVLLGRRNVRGRAIGHFMLAAEVAIAVVLLGLASLLVQSFVRLVMVNPGVDPNDVFVARTELSSARYAAGERSLLYQREVVERLLRLPQVSSAAVTSALPLGGMSTLIRIRTEDGSEHSVALVAIAGDYFSVLRVRVLRGALPPAPDGPTDDTELVVNDTLARLLFRGNAVGKRLLVGADAEVRRIGAQVEDMKLLGLDVPPEPTVYLPFGPLPQALRGHIAKRLTFLLRTREEAPTPNTLRAAIAEVDPGQPLYDLLPLRRLMMESVRYETFRTLVVIIFAAASIVVLASGVFGVTYEGVAQRTREIGIRLAVGATRTSVVKSILLGCAVAIASGLALGLCGSVICNHLVAYGVFGISAMDVSSYFIATVCIVFVAAAAALIPVKHAVGIDPVAALRDE